MIERHEVAFMLEDDNNATCDTPFGVSIYSMQTSNRRAASRAMSVSCRAPRNISELSMLLYKASLELCVFEREVILPVHPSIFDNITTEFYNYDFPFQRHRPRPDMCTCIEKRGS